MEPFDPKQHFGYKSVMIPQFQNAKASHIYIKFKVNCGSTLPGETLKVTGNCIEFGNWDPSTGLQLHTNNDDFPIWKGQLNVD